MPLKNIRTLPPGGWRYDQKETGWKLSSMSPFTDAVGQIVLHRVANQLPRAKPEEAAEDLENFTCQRLGNDRNYCLSGDVKKKLMLAVIGAATHVRNLAGRAAAFPSTLASGAAILYDWLGDAMRPVGDGIAQSRSDICTGRNADHPCTYNQPGAGASLITSPIADAIRLQMQRKTEMNLSVVDEEKLHTCAICLCDLKLKVHVPLDVITGRTSDRMISKFREQAPHCWLVHELNQTQNPAKT